MGSVHSYTTADGKRSYFVRYRKPDGTNASKRGFPTKRDALEYIATVSVAITNNQYVDPARARVTVATLANDWLQDQAAILKPSSFRPLESAWRIHVGPRWGKVQAARITYSDIRAWITELTATHGPTTVIRCHGILASILDVAVRDRRIADNPARGVKLPRRHSKRRVYLSHRQVDLVARESLYPELVYFLAYTGLRWGELTALRIQDVNLARRRVRVQENAVMVGSKVHVGTPKTHVSRSVPYPEFLDPVVRIMLGTKDPTQLLFGDGEHHMRLPNSKNGWFAAAVRRAQQHDSTLPRLTPHDLRHTAASLAISAGANVKAVQRMLGHASAAMTLDTYADLFDDDLDYVANALGAARASSIQIIEARPIAAPGSPISPPDPDAWEDPLRR